jgi:hypothetical protein
METIKNILAILLIFLFGCQNNTKNTDVLKVSISKTGEIVNDVEANTYFPITLSLENTSSDTICFWAMNCAWNLNWRVVEGAGNFNITSCDRNFPKLYCVNPHEKMQYKNQFNISNPAIKKLKVFFVYVKKEEYNLNESNLVELIQNKLTKNCDIFESNSIFW